MGNVDNVVPGEKWVFDESVADCFENMLSRSIPQYDVMRSSVSNLCRYIIEKSNKHTVNMLDLGCSDGLMIDSLKSNLDTLEDRHIYIIQVVMCLNLC